MRFPTPSFYANWRSLRECSFVLHEDRNGRPPEKLLQSVWVQQRLKRMALRTTGGATVTVLHPGFWNREAGPDFRGAIIQFDGDTPVEGDIEIDVLPDGWKAHGHGGNPDFCGVKLHVVWEARRRPATNLPTLELRPFLDAPLGELYELLDHPVPPPLSGDQQGRCVPPLKELSAEELEAMLTASARLRLESRAAQICARARQAGWDHTLLEGMFRALGYKNNGWSMQRLAELSPQIGEAMTRHDPIDWQAALLGTAGLLPDPLVAKDDVVADYLKNAWHIWWRLRSRVGELALPKSAWRLRGLRPANHPVRRLALASHWLSAGNLPRQVQSWFESVPGTPEDSNSKLGASLLQILMPGSGDAFWEYQYTFRSPRLDASQPLLGLTRLNDIAVNAILPWLFSRAAEGGNEDLRGKAERLWFTWPKSEDNAILRQARARLLGNATPTVLSTAAHQQGLIQIVRDFCDCSNAICRDCRFPSLVEEWRASQP